MKHSRWLSLVILCTGFLLIVVDMTIVNVALPSIGRDLRFSAAGLAWVVNGYLVAFAGLLLLAGRLADLVGGKRVFMAGLFVFTLGSFACGLAQNQWMLVVARFIQGVGGAASSAVILAMIVGLFPEPNEQAKAFGVFSFIASAGAAIGLVAGGVITQTVNWHWIFFVNVPLGGATAILGQRFLPLDRRLVVGGRPDVLGAALVTAALMLGIYSIVTASLTPGLGALALLAAFVVRQARAANPIMPLRLLRSRVLAGANAVQALMSAAFLGFFFVASLDLERVLGYDPLALGLGFLPVAVVMGVFSVRYGAKLTMRFGPFRVLMAGQAVAAAALVLVAAGPDHAEYVRDLFVPMALLGLGGGLTFPALTLIAMSETPPADSGLASGLLNTTGQVGGALGLAVLAAVAATRAAALAPGAADPLNALAGGYHLAWTLSAAAVVVSAAVAAVTLRPRRVIGAAQTEPVEQAA
jgi:EmrB/QacA subfamily drug resistance transporter